MIMVDNLVAMPKMCIRDRPTTASLASSGIVTVPGMMAGQIIAGGNPIDAAKYQFLILAAIAALTLLADSRCV